MRHMKIKVKMKYDSADIRDVHNTKSTRIISWTWV